MRDKRDRAITCVFRHDLRLTVMFSGLYEKICRVKFGGKLFRAWIQSLKIMINSRKISLDRVEPKCLYGEKLARLEGRPTIRKAEPTFSFLSCKRFATFCSEMNDKLARSGLLE